MLLDDPGGAVLTTRKLILSGSLLQMLLFERWPVRPQRPVSVTNSHAATRRIERATISAFSGAPTPPPRSP